MGAASRENLSSWFPTQSNTNSAVQQQKMARGLKFQIKKVDGLYYLCSENKGTDQLCGDRAADLHLCFRIYAKSRFSHDAAHGWAVASELLVAYYRAVISWISRWIKSHIHVFRSNR